MKLEMMRDLWLELKAEAQEPILDLAEVLEAAATAAETQYDFGPSTVCPNCGDDRAIQRAYRLGREDAAKAIRALKP